MLFLAQDAGRAKAVEALQAVLFRLLTCIPPGKVRFTILDPVGLGQNFAAFMDLADHDDLLVTSRIWTETAHIEQRLADLTAHMENVIQKYLRDRYPTINDYNAMAGEVAEPFRILVVANFPTNFSADACRRLVSIAQNGPRCGVLTLITVDRKQPMPEGFDLADLQQAGVRLTWDDGQLRLGRRRFRPLPADAGRAARRRAGRPAPGSGRPAVADGPPRRGAVRVHRAGAGAVVDGRQPQAASTCRSAAPGPRRGSTCGSARARPSTSSSPAKPGPANRRCCTRSSPTWPCSTRRTRWSCTWWTSRRASSSRPTPPTACRTPASSPWRASASSA